MPKLAPQAVSWYNRGRKKLSLSDVISILRREHNLIGGYAMDSLSPRDLTPQERKKAYNRAYYQTHHQEIRDQQKEYNAAHSDEIKVYGQEWRESHRAYNRAVAKLDRQLNGDIIRARQRVRYHENSEQIKEQVRIYQQAHKEQVRARKRAHRDANFARYAARDREYRLANIERVRLWNRAIKARRRTRIAQFGGSYTVQEWLMLKAKYDHTCLCCGRQEPEIKLTADHILPVTKGGSSFISNIQPLCGSCNSKKHNKIIDYRARFEHERSG